MYDPYRQQNPQLFQDTSNPNYGYQEQNYNPNNQYMANPTSGEGYRGPPPSAYGYPASFPGSQLMQDPIVANMAMQYGHNLMGHGKEYVDSKLEKIVSVTKMKYFFAVDSKYVLKKLQILLFPFAHSDWSIKYSSEDEGPIQPRYDVNAPDLYIPLMAFLTYILLSGLCLGLQNRFSPDVLGIQASWSIVWLMLELGVVTTSLYVTAIRTNLQFLHWLSLSSYKFVGMVVTLLAAILLGWVGYYCVLCYLSFSLVTFLFRSLRCQLQGDSGQGYSSGTKRRFYILMLISTIQPIMMWLLTMQLVPKKS